MPPWLPHAVRDATHAGGQPARLHSPPQADGARSASVCVHCQKDLDVCQQCCIGAWVASCANGETGQKSFHASCQDMNQASRLTSMLWPLAFVFSHVASAASAPVAWLLKCPCLRGMGWTPASHLQAICRFLFPKLAGPEPFDKPRRGIPRTILDPLRALDKCFLGITLSRVGLCPHSFAPWATYASHSYMLFTSFPLIPLRHLQDQWPHEWHVSLYTEEYTSTCGFYTILPL